jgi:hypothetical protein
MRVFMSGHWGILLRTIIAACLFVSVRGGYAQESFRLGGVKTVRLLIEDFSPKAAECGISEDLVRSAFMYPASSARFKIVSEASDATFYIAVTTVYAPLACARPQSTLMCAQSVNLSYSLMRLSLPRSSFGTRAGLVSVILPSTEDKSNKRLRT